MSERKSLDTIIKNVRELANEYPDAVYRTPEGWEDDTKCSYIEGKAGNGEGCIIGQASIGSLVKTLDSVSHTSIIKEVITNLQGRHLKDVTSEKINWLQEVQTKQDIGETWFEAVQHADEQVGEIGKK